MLSTRSDMQDASGEHTNDGTRVAVDFRSPSQSRMHQHQYELNFDTPSAFWILQGRTIVYLDRNTSLTRVGGQRCQPNHNRDSKPETANWGSSGLVKAWLCFRG